MSFMFQDKQIGWQQIFAQIVSLSFGIFVKAVK